MARTTLTAVESEAYGGGVADTSAEAVDNVNGNDFANDGRTIMVVENGSGGSLTVTLTLPAGPKTAGESITKTLAVDNGDEAHFGPFLPSIFNNADGRVYVDWSSGTSVTAAIVKQLPTPR